jgi:hypothetical protein
LSRRSSKIEASILRPALKFQACELAALEGAGLSFT